VAVIWAVCTLGAAVSGAAAWASTMGMAAIGMDIGAAYPHTTITAMGTNDVKRSWAIPAAVEEWPHLGLFFWRRASTITGDIFMPSLQRDLSEISCEGHNDRMSASEQRRRWTERPSWVESRNSNGDIAKAPHDSGLVNPHRRTTSCLATDIRQIFWGAGGCPPVW
jgi:hypothetical protein